MRLLLSNWAQRYGLIGVAVTWLAASVGHAQITYLSANRGATVSLGYDTNSLAQEGTTISSYSGNYSAAAGPSSPFADFSTVLGGSAGVAYSLANLTNTWSASAGAEQTSSLNAQGILFSASVNEGGNRYPDYCNEASFLQVSFIVSAPVSYELTCEGGPDPFFSAESWRLTSANLGVLVNGSDKGAGGTSGIPVSYSGVLVPGDEYTLTLQETAGFTTSPYGDSGGLQVDFTVPESAPQWLLGWGLGGVLALRMKRWRKSDGAAESARENRP